MLRLLALAFVALSLYYARFFIAVRQEASTLVQIGVLLVAAAVLSVPLRLPRMNLRALGIFGVAAAVLVFRWADLDSHSVSDTLTRAVPAWCVILSIALRLTPERTAARQ